MHTTDYALFSTSARRKSSVSDDLFGTNVFGSSASVGNSTSGVGSNSIRENTTSLLTSLTPYTTPYVDTINKLRTELVYILHLALEHVSGDINKLPRTSFVYMFLHTMIVHRVVLPTNTSTSSVISPSNPTGASGGGDMLGSGELILKHIRAMMYHNNSKYSYLTLLYFVHSATSHLESFFVDTVLRCESQFGLTGCFLLIEVCFSHVYFFLFTFPVYCNAVHDDYLLTLQAKSMQGE